MSRALKTLLASVALLLVVSAGAMIYFRASLARTIGTGPAGPPVPRQGWSAPWRTQPVLVLGLGDSVTAGFGASSGHSYFDRLISNPPDEFEELKGLCLGSVFPKLKAVNLSVSGTISMEHLSSQLPKLETAGNDTLGVVVMTTGGNDLIHDYGHSPPREGAMYGATMEQAKPWIELFEKRIDTMMAGIRSRFPGGCHIFIANIFDPTDGEGDIENAGHRLPPWKDGEAILAAYNAAIERVSRTRSDLHVVNVHDAFLGHGIHCAEMAGRHYRPEDPHYWYSVNLEDPNERGYDAIRRLFLLEIARTLARHR